jgi:predicted membrane-bound spermidine synthase
MRTSFKVGGLLSLVFFLSGAAALVYQVVWQRLLATYYGVGPISIALIVTVYMFGLGLGALFGGALSERVRSPIVAYVWLELGIAVFGLLSPRLLELLGSYTAGATPSVAMICAFSFLCVPTLLMGATLPLLTKLLSGINPDFLAALSSLYFINTLGAAAGALVGSYGLISFFGLRGAVACAAAMNLCIAAAMLLRYGRAPTSTGVATAEAAPSGATLGNLVYPLVVVTGFLAMGYELIWFRVIGVLVKDSPYAFASVLATYLLGIAIGSRQMRRYLERGVLGDRRRAFFLLQVSIACTVGLTLAGYYALTRYTPFEWLTRASFAVDTHPDLRLLAHPGLSKEFALALFSLFDTFLWSGIFVLVPTVLMGASFPLAASLSRPRVVNPGQTVGWVYFFTVVGNTAGGLCTGLVLLPQLGTERTCALFCAGGLAFGLGLLPRRRTGSFRMGHAVVGALALLAVLVTFYGKGQLYRAMHHPPGPGFVTHVEEGLDGVVVTYQNGPSVTNYINGSSHGGRPLPAFTYEALQAMTRARRLDRVLVVGYGTGTIVEALLESRELKELVLVELNRTLLTNLRKMPLFDGMLRDRRVRLVIDDGRRFLVRSAERFDLIVTDPLRTTTSPANNLFSADFFRLVQAHLDEGGVYLSWFDEQRVVPRTLASVFRWIEAHSYFSLCSDSPFYVSEGRRGELLSAYGSADREAILSNEGATQDRAAVLTSTSGYPVNTDWEPWTEYYLGLVVKEQLGLLGDGALE